MGTDEFGLHEQVSESGMGQILGLGEHHLRVAGQFDAPLRVGMVGEGHPPEFPRRLRANTISVCTSRPAWRWRNSARAWVKMASYPLEARRVGWWAADQNSPGLLVAQVDEGAPVVARGVLAPSGSRPGCASGCNRPRRC